MSLITPTNGNVAVITLTSGNAAVIIRQSATRSQICDHSNGQGKMLFSVHTDG